jgi:aerobic-type carbon monoxide dehydrogenase small subunit (CoxS/CutS family)
MKRRMPTIKIKGRSVSHTAEPDTPLPRLLRGEPDVAGTQFGRGGATGGVTR